MRLTVLSLAYPFAPVGENAVGGSEQVLSAIDRALVHAGHRSIVVAPRGSSVAGELAATTSEYAPLEGPARERAQERHARLFERVLARERVDIVHMQNLDSHRYLHLAPAQIPVLVTLHLPPDWYPSDLFHTERPNTCLQCVSRTQRDACPTGARTIELVENGVQLDRFRPFGHKRNFVLALGRICPEKGLHLALDAARLAGRPAVLAGQVFPYESHQRYFTEEIQPRLRPGSACFAGPLDWARKRRFLAAARCLLVPSLVAETSSLVAMEALACGTPVIAFPAGALAEIIEDGKTGYLVQDEKQMAAAIERAEELSPEACRRRAEERFSGTRMTSEYLALYRRLACPRGAAAELDGQPARGLRCQSPG